MSFSENPKYNSSLNLKNSGWLGYYLYNTNAEPVGDLVVANRENFAYFNDSLGEVGISLQTKKVVTTGLPLIVNGLVFLPRLH